MMQQSDSSSAHGLRATLATLLDDSNHARSAIARRAGLHRSTLYRALEEAGDLRLETLREIALACGMDTRLSFAPLSDPAAADAGRVLLAGESGEQANQQIRAWIGRLRRYSGDDPARIAVEAGTASSLHAREHAVRLRVAPPVHDLAAAAERAGAAWALSGAPALRALGRHNAGTVSTGQHTTILWTSEAERVAYTLGEPWTRDKIEDNVSAQTSGGAELILCAPSQLTLTGAAQLDGIWLVAPAQAVIDAHGLGGELSARASTVTDAWAAE